MSDFSWYKMNAIQSTENETNNRITFNRYNITASPNVSYKSIYIVVVII